MHINAENVVLNILKTRSETAHNQLCTIVLCNEQVFTLSGNDMQWQATIHDILSCRVIWCHAVRCCILWNATFLVLFPNIWTLPHFRRIQWLFLYYNFVLHSSHKQDMNIQLAFSAPMSRPNSLPATDKTGVDKELAGTRADKQWQSQTHELMRWECQYH